MLRTRHDSIELSSEPNRLSFRGVWPLLVLLLGTGVQQLFRDLHRAQHAKVREELPDHEDRGQIFSLGGDGVDS